MLNFWRFLGVAFFGSAALFSAYAFIYSTVTWLREIHFYWQLGWNFDSPPPEYQLHKAFGPRATGSFDRLVYGWPFKIALYGFLALSGVKLVKHALTTDPRDIDPRVLARNRKFAMWFLLGCLGAALALSVFINMLPNSQELR